MTITGEPDVETTPEAGNGHEPGGRAGDERVDADRHHDGPTPSARGRTTRSHLPWGAIAISIGLALVLLVQLVRSSGAWAVAANTRILDVLIRTGLVRLTDMDAGYIDGVPQAEYYLRSQSAIDWLPIAIAVTLCSAAIVVRAARAAATAPAFGVDVRPLDVLAVMSRAETGDRVTPFRMTGASAVTRLARIGAPARAASDLVAARRALMVAELLVFALVGVVLVGIATWIEAMFIAALTLAVCARIAGAPTRVERRADRRAARARAAALLATIAGDRRRAGLAVLGFVALPIEEVAGYLTVQALSSEVVILGGVTPTVVLVALVAGKTASFVPITPGGIGLFEWGFAAALYAQGQGLAEAVTITLVFMVVRLVAAAVVGAGNALLLRRAPGEGAHTESAVGQVAAVPTETHDEPAAATPDRSIVPTGTTFARRLFVVAAVLLGFHLLGRLRELAVDFWLLESLGYERVFWTDMAMASLLFVIGGAAWALAIYLPLTTLGDPLWSRRWAAAVAGFVGIVAGLWWSGHAQQFLLLRHGRSFGMADPVFGNDIGFYVFDLPALRTIVWGALAVVVAALAVTAVLVVRRRGRLAGSWRDRLAAALERLAVTPVLALLATAGTLAAIGVWLQRYDVLVKSNYDSSIAAGAEALDVTGVLSTVNLKSVQAIAVLLFTGALIVMLVRHHPTPPAWTARGPSTRALLATPVVIAVVASAAVAIRDVTRVTPNEPVSQLEFIQRHIDATNAAWGLDDVELIDVAYNSADDPLPPIETVLDHPSLRNAQLWPGAASWLERLLDPQHVDRLFLEAEERHPDLVFAATLDTFRQQQKLRPYYDFLDVDVVNYPDADDIPRLMASSVRELPLLEPQPWLAFWGQRFVLFTHGYGLVAAPVGEIGSTGGPVYASSDVPPVASLPELRTERNAVYYGEGSGTIGFSNVAGLAEFDYPTEQDRVDVVLPADVDAGVRVDSFAKRLAFSWGVQEFFDPRNMFDLLFSDLITSETRVHVQRQPLDRVAAIAPFLYLDSDPYAVAHDGGIMWMVNGVTTTDRYPYSAYEELGDKSVRRGPFPANVRVVNYAADSVKVTVDAYTGKVVFYKIADEPVVDTWAAIYPDLFQPASEMPDDLRAQQQYPAQLFHTQFDDLWIYYHVTEALPFFNQEDLFDDADEVLGPMLAPGKGITFSIEPYPAVVESTRRPGRYDFVSSQVFTPEGARNLRSIVSVVHGDDGYGELSMQRLAKGSFTTGPEQAESIIDQAADIAQQFGFWNTTGVEVIRGYITPMVIDNELIYVEPVFIRSEQNPFPQLARTVVVMRDTAAMDVTPAAAIEQLYEQLDR